MMILPSATGLAAVAATLSSIANGAQLVATRFVVQQNDPLAVALLRYTIAFACLVPLLPNASRWPTRRDCAIILILGAIVAGICPWLLTLSMQYTTASRGALVLCTSPLLTLTAAALLGYERCTIRRLIGTLCALLGVMVGLSDRLLTGTAQSFVNRGDAVVMFTTILLALFNVYAGTMLRRYRATTIVPIATMGGLVVLEENIDSHINSTQRRKRAVARQLRENFRNAKDRMRLDFLLKPRGFLPKRARFGGSSRAEPEGCGEQNRTRLP